MSERHRTLRLLLRLLGPPVAVLLGAVIMAALGLGRWVPPVLPFALLISCTDLILILAIALTTRRHSGQFSNEHIIEFARRLAKAKAAALALLEKPYEGEMEFRDDAAREQGNMFETSEHLKLYYTIDHEGENYRHHISMSDTKRVFTLSAGQHFSGFLNELLRVDLPSLAFMGQSDRLIFHISFALPPDEQRHFAETPISIPEPAELAAFRARAREVVTEMRRRAAAGRRRGSTRLRIAKRMPAETP